LRGIGVLFLMWNVPYLVALWHPIRHRISLYEWLAIRSIYSRDRVRREGVTTLLASQAFKMQQQLQKEPILMIV
jgi:hypothetical protein